MDDTIRAMLEEEIRELPVIQYAWVSKEEIPFSERVRTICKEECPRYGKSWACPPGVGTVEECRAACSAFEGAFVFTTVAEVQDIMNMEETLATRGGHEDVTREIRFLFQQHSLRTLAMSGDSCAICPECAYPAGPCRYPERMIPCIEGYGIVVPLLAQRAGIAFENGGGVVTWFGLILYGG